MGKILKNLSILQKFLFINLLVFIVLGIFTFFLSWDNSERFNFRKKREVTQKFLIKQFLI